MAKKKKYDWLEIRKAYITGQNITFKELADIFGISESSISKKSMAENWTEKRRKYQEKLLNKACDKVAEKTSSKLARIADKLVDKLEIATGELHTHEEINMFGKLIKKETETIRVGKLSAIVKSVALLQKNELEKEKLEIEKAKLTNGNDNENKVMEYMEAIQNGVELDDEE